MVIKRGMLDAARYSARLHVCEGQIEKSQGSLDLSSDEKRLCNFCPSSLDSIICI